MVVPEHAPTRYSNGKQLMLEHVEHTPRTVLLEPLRYCPAPHVGCVTWQPGHLLNAGISQMRMMPLPLGHGGVVRAQLPRIVLHRQSQIFKDPTRSEPPGRPCDLADGGQPASAMTSNTVTAGVGRFFIALWISGAAPGQRSTKPGKACVSSCFCLRWGVNEQAKKASCRRGDINFSQAPHRAPTAQPKTWS